MTTQEFFDKWNKQPCNPDGAYGNQCVDVADEYAKDVVGSPLPPVRGAKDFWSMSLNGYTKIANTPDNIPQLGDIIIFDGNFGHVSIFKSGDQNSFISFDQNFPTQGYYDNYGNFIGTGVCHFQEHNYLVPKVLGWFRAITEPMATITQKGLDQLRNDLQAQIAKNKVLQDQLTVCLNKPLEIVTHTITVPPTNITFTPHSDVPIHTSTGFSGWWTNFIHSLWG